MAIGNEEDADLLSIGAHCSHPECNQLDFLPFQCNACNKIYCQYHRMASDHACPRADLAGDNQVVVCPVCAKAVKLVAGEDPNVTYTRHSSSSACDPANYAKVHKKQRCPVPNCREKLTTVNVHRCKECGINTCLKHRLTKDHNCPGPKPARTAARSAFPQGLRSFLGGIGFQQGQKQDTTPAPSQRTVNRQNPNGQKASSQHLGEQCPQCHKRFSKLEDMMQHAAVAHENGWVSGSSVYRFEACPHCAATFNDPVELVRHVEASHGAQRPEVCVLC